MTGKRRRGDPAMPLETDPANDAARGITELDATATKASVHEAIGKLIGDDDERRRGTAEKVASGSAPDKSRKPSGT